MKGYFLYYKRSLDQISLEKIKESINNFVALNRVTINRLYHVTANLELLPLNEVDVIPKL